MAKSGASRRHRARVFVGSSTEGLDVAYAIQENLEADADVTVWPQGIFEPSSTASRSLAQVLGRSDFGVFVFTPDDKVRLRKRTYSAVRDNVIYELGLFTGKLGSDRTFIVVPNGINDLRIPTDITGVTPGRYDPKRTDKNLLAALGPFCNRLRRALKKHRGTRSRKPAAVGRAPSMRGVTIHSAVYGAGDDWVDVKAPLTKALKRYGVARAGNELAGDPLDGVDKALRLNFSIHGERRQVQIPEGGYVRFPGKAT